MPMAAEGMANYNYAKSIRERKIMFAGRSSHLPDKRRALFYIVGKRELIAGKQKALKLQIVDRGSKANGKPRMPEDENKFVSEVNLTVKSR